MINKKLFEISKLKLNFKKDAKNPFFKSTYLPLEGLVETLEPHLIENNILITHFTKDGNVITKVIDIEDDSFVESLFPLSDTQDPQKLGSCITYAKRYNIGQIFNIITDRDDDGNSASGNTEKTSKKEAESITTVEDKGWYNDTDKHLEEWKKGFAEGKYTAEKIINKIVKDGYKLNKKARQAIIDAEVDVDFNGGLEN